MKTTSTEKQLSIEDLLKQYQRYLIKVASTLTKDDYIKEELIAEGNIGLWKAYQRYTEGDGELHSYLISYIKGYMLNYLTTNTRTIKVPANIVHHINRTEGLEFTSTLSLDKKIGDEDSSTLGDMVEDHYEDNYLDDQQESIRSLLRQYLNQLKERYQTILKLRYFEEKTYLEISDELNTSVENIRQQHDKAINQLQELFQVEKKIQKRIRMKPQKRPNKK
jgi:RNA polymerase sigma factor (sigma-70 family)